MSSRPEQEVIQHFSHIHPLKKVDGCGEFTCDGCKTYGYGGTYHCACCNYNLHNHCATCPPNLLSFMHPQHELRLVCRRPEQTHQNRRICDICDESVEGMYYHCEPCGFNVHPLCTQLPHRVRHVPHLAHLLELSNRGASNTCMVCQGAIQSWRYKCGPCGLDIHMECVNSFSSTEVAATHQRGFGSQPQSHPFNQHHQPYPFDQHHQPHRFYQHDQPHPFDQHHQPHRFDQHHQPHPFDQHHQPHPFYQHDQPYPFYHHYQPHPFYHHHQPHPFSQHYQPYNSHGYNYGYINQAQVQESSNEGEVQESSPSFGKKMYNILSALTTGVVCNIMAAPACSFISGFF